MKGIYFARVFGYEKTLEMLDEYIAGFEGVFEKWSS
jgi:hypothetical protein